MDKKSAKNTINNIIDVFITLLGLGIAILFVIWFIYHFLHFLGV